MHQLKRAAREYNFALSLHQVPLVLPVHNMALLHLQLKLLQPTVSLHDHKQQIIAIQNLINVLFEGDIHKPRCLQIQDPDESAAELQQKLLVARRLQVLDFDCVAPLGLGVSEEAAFGRVQLSARNFNRHRAVLEGYEHLGVFYAKHLFHLDVLLEVARLILALAHLDRTPHSGNRGLVDLAAHRQHGRVGVLIVLRLYVQNARLRGELL